MTLMILDPMIPARWIILIMATNWQRRSHLEPQYGLALCGSGIGISIAVNRNPACRAALVSEPLSAKLAREHNDANVIAMGARLTGSDMAKACLDAFLNTDFGGDRHVRRVDKLSNPPFVKEII
jgi:ribose 5-phosphate isomerase B